MIPQTQDDLVNDVVIIEQPSYTYHMNLAKNKIVENCDNLEAMKQVVYKIINTERYQCLIYSWNYGIELQDLLGMPTSFCIPEIERRITEALLQDERISKVFDFVFTIPRKGIIHTGFRVETTKGTIEAEKEVEV